MKKGFVAFLLLVGFALVSGIVGAQESITYWFWNPPEQFAKFEPLIKKFEEETGIQVELRQVNSWEMKQKFLVAATGGVAPDVISVSSSWAEELGMAGVMADLRPMMARDKYGVTDFFPSALEVWQRIDGFQYAFPFDLDIKQLWYNKEVLNATGVVYPDENYNWDRWLADAMKVSRDANGDGKPEMYAIHRWWWNWLSLIPANGGEFFTQDRSASALGGNAALEAIRYWAQWWPDAKNTLLLQENVLATLGIPDNNSAFKNSKVAFAGGGAYLAKAVMFNPEQGDWRFDFDVTEMPKSFSGQRFTEVGGQGLAISAQSHKKDAAWKFVKFMTSPEVQRISFGELGQFSVRRSVALSHVYLGAGGPPANKMAFIKAAAAYGHPFPKGVLWPQSSKVITNQLDQYFRGKLGLEEALEQIDRLVKPILEEAQTIK